MTTVACIRCASYEEQAVEQAVHQALEALGGIKKYVQPGHRVLLKVNMLQSCHPNDAITTHPLVAKAVAKEVLAAGGTPVIGDSPGNGYARIEHALESCGFKGIAEELGIETINFEKAGVAEVPSQNPLIKSFFISRAVLDADVVISLPKLKTHNFTRYTGAVKNMFGSITGFNKGKVHYLAPKPLDFATAIVDIFSHVKPHLAVMDAVVGMEGHGPTGGTPRPIGLILASDDCVALDAVGGKLIGYEPRQVDTTRIAGERGLGESSLEKIEIEGVSIKEGSIPDFKLVTSAADILDRVPSGLIKVLGPLANRLIQIRPVLGNPERCTGCAICAKHCPQSREDRPKKAIQMVDGKPTFDYRECIFCYCCHELCPNRALLIKQSYLARKWMIGHQGAPSNS